MKQLIVVLAIVATVLAFGYVEAQQPRGDLYGARAIQSLEQALSASGTLRFPNYAADPFACAAATYGSYYYNTVANESRICDNAGWTAVGGAGLTVGTAATLPMWNGVPDDLVDSALTDDGTNVETTEAMFFPAGAVGLPAIAPTGDANTGYWFSAADVLDSSAGGEPLTIFTNLNAAGVGGDIWTFTEDLPILDGGDVVNGILVDITNENHTGVDNLIYGVYVDIDADDAQAQESAYGSDALWSFTMTTDSTALRLGSIQTTGTLEWWIDTDSGSGDKRVWYVSGQPFSTVSSGNVVNVGNAQTIDGGNGTDLKRGVWVDVETAADWTNAGNKLSAFGADAITPQVNVDESLFEFGDGWTYFLDDEVDTALGTLTWTTNADKTANAKSGTLRVYINGAEYHIQLYAN